MDGQLVRRLVELMVGSLVDLMVDHLDEKMVDHWTAKSVDLLAALMDVQKVGLKVQSMAA